MKEVILKSNEVIVYNAVADYEFVVAKEPNCREYWTLIKIVNSYVWVNTTSSNMLMTPSGTTMFSNFHTAIFDMFETKPRIKMYVLKDITDYKKWLDENFPNKE